MRRNLFLSCLFGICLATGAGAGVLPRDSAEQYELTFWESIKDSKHAADYEAYLQAYPKGRFVGLARTRVERYRTAGARTGGAAEEARSGAGTQSPPAPPAIAGQSGPPGATAPKQPPRRIRLPAKQVGTMAGVDDPVIYESPLPTPALPPAPVAEVTDCATCPTLVVLPKGGFTMGSNSDDPTERPAFHVTIGAPFAIGKYEITVDQWQSCVSGGGCAQVTTDLTRAPTSPARDISWDDAQAYTQWLSKLTGKSYRLPTEAEWEYAARAGTTTRYWWGELMTTGRASCKDCGEPWKPDAPVAVGSFMPNRFGLFDMNGSVWEWVSDCWHSSYQRAPSDGRSWEEPDCRVRVLRGGSWREGGNYMPASTRFKYDASVRQSQNGFRVARRVE